MKLYEIRGEVVIYALAPSESAARLRARQWLRREVDINGVAASEVVEVTKRSWPLDGDWEPSAVVYSPDQGYTTLGEALDEAGK